MGVKGAKYLTLYRRKNKGVNTFTSVHYLHQKAVYIYKLFLANKNTCQFGNDPGNIKPSKVQRNYNTNVSSSS